MTLVALFLAFALAYLSALYMLAAKILGGEYYKLLTTLSFFSLILCGILLLTM